MDVREKFDQKLLVEGNDDQHVVWSICQQFNISETFDVVDMRGITNLMPAIPVRAKQQSVQALGILVDADFGHSNRWENILKILRDLNYKVPETSDALGTVIPSPAPNRPQVGIWLMPNNQDPGMIEDFVRFLVPDDDERLTLAEETITALEERELQKYIPNYRSKALIHTWLAWQADPGTPLGLAITKKYFSTNTELCQQFAAWLNRLFNDA